LVDAAMKSREGEHFAAAIVTVVLAAACRAAGQADLAVKAFAMAADLGHRSGDWTITAHAWSLRDRQAARTRGAGSGPSRCSSSTPRHQATVRQATRALSDLLARRGLAHVAALV
jgi:hypothetical protein